MLEKILNKLGWYAEEPIPTPVHGKLDNYNFTEEELEAVSTKKLLILNERRKQK